MKLKCTRAACRCGAVMGEKVCTCGWRLKLMAIALSVAPLACLIVIALALAGCAAPAAAPIVETRIQVQRVTLPPGLLSCQPEPALSAWTMQSQVADYIVRLHEAWADCHETVRSIAQIENTPLATPAATATDGK